MKQTETTVSHLLDTFRPIMRTDNAPNDVTMTLVECINTLEGRANPLLLYML